MFLRLYTYTVPFSLATSPVILLSALKQAMIHHDTKYINMLDFVSICCYGLEAMQ